MSLFRCPICAAPLEREDGAYRCPANHSFDLSREGYTHLLPPNRKHSAAPGDDKGMAAARREFLSKDYYRPLKEALCALAVKYAPQAPAVLDTGCGEGYYTSGIYRALCDAGKQAQTPLPRGPTFPSSSSAMPRSGSVRSSGRWLPPITCRWRTGASTCW